MGSKTVNTKDGQLIVDENFDETTLDTTSMLPEEVPDPKKQEKSSVLDTIIINGETFSGRLKVYSVQENRKTNEKLIKVILLA